MFQGHPLNFKVTQDKISPILTRIKRFRTVTQVWVTDGTKMMHKAWCSIENMPYYVSRSSIEFQGHMGQKKLILTWIERFRSVTQVWFHRWPWNDGQSLTWYGKGPLLFFKVIHQISRSPWTKKSPILTRIEHFQIWNDAQSLTYYRRGAL